MKKNAILIVDDNEFERELCREDLQEDYEVILEASDGDEALEIIERDPDSLDLVLLDVHMARIEGTEVLARLNSLGILDDLPVIMCTGEDDVKSITHLFDYPIADYIPKTVSTKVLKRKISNISELYNLKNNLQEKVREQTEDLRSKAERLDTINRATIELLGNVVEARNMESGLHVKRVREITHRLAVEYRRLFPEAGLTEEDIELISQGSVLHDLGKIMIPDNVLLKPGKLTDEEFELMKTHSLEGNRLLEQAEELWDDEYGRVCLGTYVFITTREQTAGATPSD